MHVEGGGACAGIGSVAHGTGGGSHHQGIGPCSARRQGGSSGLTRLTHDPLSPPPPTHAATADISDKCAHLLVKYFAGEEEGEAGGTYGDDDVGGGSDDGQIGEGDHALHAPHSAPAAAAGFPPQPQQQQQHFGFGVGHQAPPAGGWNFGAEPAGAQPQQQAPPGGFNFAFQ